MTDTERKEYLNFAYHMAYQLTPDLKDMHMTETAAEVRSAATMIERLVNEVLGLQHRIELNNARHEEQIKRIERKHAELALDYLEQE